MTTEQPAVPLPTGRLLAAVIGACLLVGGGWAVAAWLLGRSEAALPGGLGAAVVAVSTAAGLLAIQPWKRRPVSLWISLWLGQIVVRLLVTPALALLLYSAASVSAMPLFLAVGLAYLAAVLCEAGALARYLKRIGSD